jgi:hypothetical protein
MPRDSGGDFTLVAGNPVVSGTQITITWANSTLNDIATALTDSLSRTGSGGMESPMYFENGDQGAPGASFNSDKNSGMFLQDTGDLRFSVVSVARLRITADGVATSEDGIEWFPIPVIPTGAGIGEGSTLFWDNTLNLWTANSTLRVGNTVDSIGVNTLPSTVNNGIQVAGSVWSGNSDGTIGVTIRNNANISGGVYGALRDDPNVVATPLLVSGTALELEATTGKIELLGVGVDIDPQAGAVVISGTETSTAWTPEGTFSINTLDPTARFAVMSKDTDTYIARFIDSNTDDVLTIAEDASVTSVFSSLNLSVTGGTVVAGLVISGAGGTILSGGAGGGTASTLGMSDLGAVAIDSATTLELNPGTDMTTNVTANNNCVIQMAANDGSLWRVKRGTLDSILVLGDGQVAVGGGTDTDVMLGVRNPDAHNIVFRATASDDRKPLSVLDTGEVIMATMTEGSGRPSVEVDLFTGVLYYNNTNFFAALEAEGLTYATAAAAIATLLP